ncbi:MAG: tyrosine-type recombinase/integrase [Clostridia bacterium]|nr:tyrosine-type recombinase/integrase [Clostridia bacterium]
MEFERILALYMNDCYTRQLRPKTMHSYEQTLRLFCSWMNEKYGLDQVEDVKDIHIRTYINDLQSRGKYTYSHDRQTEKFNCPQHRKDYRHEISNITINNYLRNLKAFFSWLVETEYIDRSPLKKIRLLPDERRAKEYLEDEEVMRLLKSMSKSHFHEYRDYVAIMIMLDSGTRLGETLSAENEQLNLHERCLHLPADKTKGRKARTVYFSAKTARELKYWLQFRDRYCNSDYLFPVRHTGLPIHLSDFEKNFTKYCHRAGIWKRVSPHTLRNNFAKRCLLAGMDIYSLSRILGHSSVTVTEQAYLDITDRDLKRQYSRFSPIEGIYSGKK